MVLEKELCYKEYTKGKYYPIMFCICYEPIIVDTQNIFAFSFFLNICIETSKTGREKKVISKTDETKAGFSGPRFGLFGS